MTKFIMRIICMLTEHLYSEYTFIGTLDGKEYEKGKCIHCDHKRKNEYS